ncbi:MAG TPA: hypothetical protein PK916_03545 [Bacteroidota bacterium]|nr:hypothetical protein [Bacteroidota bacterium]
MKHALSLSLLALVLLATACSDDPQSNSMLTAPASNGASVNMNLDLGQIALIDEMSFLEEDMSVLLNSSQLSTYENLITAMDGDRRGPRMGIDMAAIAWLNLIIRANPDLTGEQISALRDLIRQYAELRLAEMNSGKSREEIAEALKQLHEQLIAAINAAVGDTAVQNAEKLKAELEQKRRELQEKLEQLRIDREVARMKAALGLTDDQAADVAAILKWQHEQMRLLREQYKGDPEGYKAALAELLATIDTKMTEAIGDLWTKWKEIRSGKIPIDPAQRIELQIAELTKLLGLTPDQAAAIKQLLIEQQAQIDELMKDTSLDRRELAQRMNEINKTTHEKIMSLLTPEQQKLFQRWRMGGIRPGGRG